MLWVVLSSHWAGGAVGHHRVGVQGGVVGELLGKLNPSSEVLPRARTQHPP